MILTRSINIKINEGNYSYYENLGYDVIISEEIEIPIELLSKGSHHNLRCKCDSCGLEKDVLFKNYVKYGNNWGEYYCRKCSEFKRKKSLKESYGVEYPIQNKTIRTKIKEKIYKGKVKT